MQQSIKFDLGEKRHIRTQVKPVGGEEKSFIIRSARWELKKSGNIVDSGDCTIIEHELDAVITPPSVDDYTLKLTYEIADEIWVDVIHIEVR